MDPDVLYWQMQFRLSITLGSMDPDVLYYMQIFEYV